MNQNKKLELDGIDLLLVLAIAGLAIIVLVLMAPIFPEMCASLWHGCLIVLKFWRWPTWIWTILCGTALVVLIWLKKQFD
jgi:hypothetical protein